MIATIRQKIYHFSHPHNAKSYNLAHKRDVATIYFRTFATMKRTTFIHIGITLLLALALCGCGGGNSTNNSDKECIFVSIAPLRPLVEAITGDDFDIEILVPTGASPESFEPTPRQFITLNKARMVMAVGLIDFERNLLSKIEQKGKIINLSQGIELIAGSCSHHHHGHHCTHGIDPHIWTSPVALKTMARNAYEAIAAAYPDSTKYSTNYTQLQSQLDSLDCSVRHICENARVRRFVIYHPALTYLARDYGLEQISIEHEGKEPSAKRLATIIGISQADNIRKIFYQSTYPRSTVEVIAEDIGAEPVEIDPLGEDIFSNIEVMTRLITE